MATSPDAASRHDDWAASTADRIESVVDAIRAKTSRPLDRVARLIVYGLLAAVLGTAAAVLAAIGIVRLLTIAADEWFGEEVWVAHLVTGGIFTVAGLFAWGKGRTRKTEV